MTPRERHLLARLITAADTDGRVTFVDADDHHEVSRRQLHEEARGVAAALQARGVSPGDHVGFLAPTSRQLVTALEAAWLCGAAAVVLPLPMRLNSIEAFVAQTRARVRKGDVRLLLVDEQLAPFVDSQPGDPPLVELGSLAAPVSAWSEPKLDVDSLAILQFTSGSTADPKGVMLPHRAVTANLDGIERAARVDPADDVVVSWLPLYHDMGLIGTLLLPLTTGTDLVLAGPQDFMAAPRRWMEWMSRFGGTATAGPNFAYALAARALRRLDGLDLSRWRIALNGAEPVDPRSVADFCEAAIPHGLDPGAVFPAFGMAEATLGVTFPEPGRGLQTDTIDRRVLETDRYAAPVATDADHARSFVRLGRALHNLEIRVCDVETGRVLTEREVGELEIRGESVTNGYYGDLRATEEAFHDGWLRTGDLAYLVDGELVVCGRLKDVIIVGGRNVLPEDAERAVAGVEGVRAGNVIAFGTEGRRREGLVIVAETKSEGERLAAIRRAVATHVRDAVGLPPDEIVLVRAGTLPKTSSGKLQRSLCRERWQRAELEIVAV